MSGDRERDRPLALPPGREDPQLAPPERRRAVALRYNPDDAPAPRVTALGEGSLAERIIELARQHNVPIRDDPLLVQALAKLDVGEAIPRQLYYVVAEIFAWLYTMDRERGSGR